MSINPYKSREERSAIAQAAETLGCGPDETSILTKHARVMRHADGAHLARLRANGEAVHIIIEGRASFEAGSGTTGTIEKGGVVGELYAHRLRYFQLADVTCEGPVTTLTIPLKRYEKVYASCPRIKDIVDRSRTERTESIEAMVQEDRVRRWEQYQQLKKYLG